MKLWVRIALIAALAILLWILVVDLAENVDEGSGSLDPAEGNRSLDPPEGNGSLDPPEGNGALDPTARVVRVA